LTSISLDTTGASSISITFRYRIFGGDNDDDVYVQYYDGGHYDNINEIGDDTENTWLTYSHTFDNAGGNAQYFINNFCIRITGSSIDKDEYLWIDDIIITKKIPIVNYELDLEVRWTSADYIQTNEYLCIYGGTQDSEALKVDVWTGAAWITVISNLSSGWNIVSVSSYLTSSNFEIRFVDTTKSSDTSKSTWQFEAVLLHTWSVGTSYLNINGQQLTII
jgi:hypothetical protein